MATFRAIHPFVREEAFKLGFEPVPGDNGRVRHPRLHGKRAQACFYKAFAAASAKARRVVAGWKESGTTLLFPQVPEERWEAARRGVAWVEKPKGTIGDLIRDKLKLVCLEGDSIRLLELAGKMGIKSTDVLLKALNLGMRGVNLNTWLSAEEAAAVAGEFGFRIDTWRNKPLPTPSAPPSRFRPRNVAFNGALDGSGCLVTFQITTSDDGTARKLMETLALGIPQS